jgi:hypothetical protein
MYVYVYLASNRFAPYSQDAAVYETERSHQWMQPGDAPGMSKQSPNMRSARHQSPTSDVEQGRTKLHRLLDEVLDKADTTDEVQQPDFENKRQQRRRQRRNIQFDGYNQQDPSIHNDHGSNSRHTPIIAQVRERPDSTLTRVRYNPYEAGDRVYEIERVMPVPFLPKYAAEEKDLRTNYGPTSSRSNMQTEPDRMARSRPTSDHEGMDYRGGQRPHKFDDDAVYIDTIPKHRMDTHPPVRTAWPDHAGNQDSNYSYVDSSDVNADPMKRNDYRDEYIMAKRSVVSTKNLISSIHDELQNIVSDPATDNYHA